MWRSVLFWGFRVYELCIRFYLLLKSCTRGRNLPEWVDDEKLPHQQKIYIFPVDCSQPHKHWSRWGGGTWLNARVAASWPSKFDGFFLVF
jgi:hypothetical protein